MSIHMKKVSETPRIERSEEVSQLMTHVDSRLSGERDNNKMFCQQFSKKSNLIKGNLNSY